MKMQLVTKQTVDFSLQILEIIVEIDSVLREVSKDKEPSSQGNHNESFSSLTTNSKASVKLPNLNIKHFSGNSLEFQSFLDSFNAAIYENDNIPPIAKFRSSCPVTSGLKLYEKRDPGTGVFL